MSGPGKILAVVILPILLFLPMEEVKRGEMCRGEPALVKVVILPYLSYAPFFIGVDEGYFEEEGLKIEFVKIERSNKAIPALSSGKLDVVGGAVSPGLLNAISRGAEIKMVADKAYISTNGCDYNQVMVRRQLIDSGQLKNPADLKGKKIAFQPHSMSQYYLEKILALGGLTLEDVETIDISNPVKLESLEKGTLDLATAVEPWVARIIRRGYAVGWMPAQKVVADFQSGLILYGPNLLRDRRDVGERFMRAYLKAVRQYNRGKTRSNIEIMSRNTGLEVDLLEEICLPPFRDDGMINLESIAAFQEWAVKKGYLDKIVPEEDYWDPSFIEQARRPTGGFP